MSGVEIIGLGHYAPKHRVLNSEIETRLGLKDGWIFKRTGIEERRYVADDEADRKSTRLNSSHLRLSRMPSSA